MRVDSSACDDRKAPVDAIGGASGLRERLQGKHLLIVDEALKTFTGHWFEYDRAVAEMNRAAGVMTTLAAHVEVAPEIQEQLGAVPTFRYTNWDGIYAYPQAWRRYLGILHHNWRVYRRLDRFLKETGPYDCVFVPTTVLHHLIAWRLLLFRHGGGRFERLVLFFRNDVGKYSGEKGVTVFKKTAHLYGSVLRLFGGHVRRRTVCLATDSERLAADYRRLCALEFEVFPSPRVSPPPRTSGAKDVRCGVTFSCLGPPRFEKGIDVLQAVIRQFLAAEPNAEAHFVIQWTVDVIDERGAVYRPDPALERDRRVTFLREPLDSDSYAQALAESDCMLLPYRLDSYYARISGVAIEAVTAGIPLIFTNNTWIETLLDTSGAGIGVDDGDAAGFARAIATMTKEYVRFRSEALVRSGLANEVHAESAFMKKLWGLSAN
jgi:glycosyltransferase involved in cell wall biosynthesis